MAIFHASMRTYSRAKGHSAVGAAAYRAGTTYLDERTGQTHDYRAKRGVERFSVLVPDGAPAWARDPSPLWNAAEAAEVRGNARVARELIVALPHELDATARAALADDVARVLVERYNVAVLVALHAPDRGGDQRNHHAHLLFTTRALDARGFGAKVRCLDDRRQGPKEVEGLRRAVADRINVALAAAGASERVDPRTLAAQARAAEARGDYGTAARLTREPTTHVGRAGTAVTRKGGVDLRAAGNAERTEANRAALATYLHRSTGVAAPRPSQGAKSARQGTGASRVPRALALSGPTRGTRATGRDAELLNAQAALWEEGVRVEREAAQAYVDGLRQSAEQSAALVDAYLAVAGRPSERPRLLEQCARNPVWVERLRRSLEARAELRALGEELPRRRRRYGRAMVATAKAQRALEDVEARCPPAWRPLTRRQWAEKRRAERTRLGQAQREERAARSMVAGSGADALKQQARALRAEIRSIERKRRSKFARSYAKEAGHRTPHGYSKTPIVRSLTP